jgi:Fis family transcriptional regulator
LPSKNFLHEHVRQALHDYFTLLDGAAPRDIYRLVLTQVEKPLLETVMDYAKGNESKAAKWLGISRGTLRKLLAQYNLDT